MATPPRKKSPFTRTFADNMRTSGILLVEDFRVEGDTDAQVWQKAIIAHEQQRKPLKGGALVYQIAEPILQNTISDWVDVDATLSSFVNTSPTYFMPAGSEVVPAPITARATVAKVGVETKLTSIGPLAGSCFISVAQGLNSKFNGGEFTHFRFAHAHIVAHYNPVFINPRFLANNIGVFCYGASQNYTISNPFALDTGAVFVASATCHADASFATAEEHFCDGFRMENGNGRYSQVCAVVQPEFDAWFRLSILRPDIVSYSLNEPNGYIYPFGVNDMMCQVTGSVIYIGMRDLRDIFGINIWDMDCRGAMPRGFARINGPIQNLIIGGSFNSEGWFEADPSGHQAAPNQAMFVLGSLRTLANINYAGFNVALNGHPITSYTGHGGGTQAESEVLQLKSADLTSIIQTQIAAGSATKTEPVDGDNIFDKDDAGVLLRTYVNNYSGDITTDTDGWNATHKLEYTAGEKITMNLYPTHAAIYDANDNALQVGFTGFVDKGQGFITFTMPNVAGASYWRASKNLPVNLMQVLKGDVAAPTDYVPFWKTLVSDTPGTIPGGGVSLPFKGKKIGIIGNSFVFQGLFFNDLKQETGASEIVSMGVNGGFYRTIRDSWNANGNAARFVDCDIILIHEGTNEYGHGPDSVGSPSDDRNQQTVYSAILDLVLTVRGPYPAKPIALTTMILRGAFASEPDRVPPAANPYGLTMENINQVIEGQGAQLNYRVCPMHRLAGINPTNLGWYCTDLLHPDNGAPDYGRKMGRWLNQEYAFVNA
jgi:hypothetical protein